MSIVSVRGDIFEAHCEAITNPVNCVGAMGKGLALEFKRRYPANANVYSRACASGALRPGQPFIFDLGVEATPRYIVNFPTKRHWRDPSRFDDIEAGLATLVGQSEQLGIGSIAIPPLGCGLGGLNWATQVAPLVRSAFARIPRVAAYLYLP